jgi:hypothetical protein
MAKKDSEVWKGETVLIPVDAGQFFSEVRKIVREELDAMPAASGSGNASANFRVDGLVQKPLFDMDELRHLFGGVSRSTIYEWIGEGLLKPKKMKGKVFFLWVDIEKMLKVGRGFDL